MRGQIVKELRPNATHKRLEYHNPLLRMTWWICLLESWKSHQLLENTRRSWKHLKCVKETLFGNFVDTNAALAIIPSRMSTWNQILEGLPYLNHIFGLQLLEVSENTKLKLEGNTCMFTNLFALSEYAVIEFPRTSGRLSTGRFGGNRITCFTNSQT